jgi:hypothetical protein
VRVRANHRDAARIRLERQQPVVFQQHHAARSRTPGRGPVLVEWKLFELPVRVRVRVVEQPQAEFHRQHAPDGVVEPLRRNLARLHQFCQVVRVTLADHFHIQPGIEGQRSRIPFTGNHPVVDQLAHRSPVGDDETLKAKFVLEDVG